MLRIASWDIYGVGKVVDLWLSKYHHCSYSKSMEI